jgi:hypothetical protein
MLVSPFFVDPRCCPRAAPVQFVKHPVALNAPPLTGWWRNHDRSNLKDGLNIGMNGA